MVKKPPFLIIQDILESFLETTATTVTATITTAPVTVKTATTTGRTIGSRFCNVHVDNLTIVLSLIQFINSFLPLRVVRHFHETETS